LRIVFFIRIISVDLCIFDWFWWLFSCFHKSCLFFDFLIQIFGQCCWMMSWKRTSMEAFAYVFWCFTALEHCY
jgi:hypothetical protein